MPVAEAQARISSVEFAEWRAFYRVEPFGDRREDLRMAQMCALAANMVRDRKKHPRAYQQKDFLPEYWQPPRKKRAWNSLLRMVEVINAAFGGEDHRKKT